MLEKTQIQFSDIYKIDDPFASGLGVLDSIDQVESGYGGQGPPKTPKTLQEEDEYNNSFFCGVAGIILGFLILYFQIIILQRFQILEFGLKNLNNHNSFYTPYYQNAIEGLYQNQDIIIDNQKGTTSTLLIMWVCYIGIKILLKGA